MSTGAVYTVIASSGKMDIEVGKAKAAKKENELRERAKRRYGTEKIPMRMSKKSGR